MRIRTGLLLIGATIGVVARPSALEAQAQRLTARQILDRIKAEMGVPWAGETVDTFKDGDPDTPVTGVAVTMMANLVITHEPTFFSHLDQLEGLEKANDAVTAAKRAFIRDHKIVVLRMHDHWHPRRPAGIAPGMTRAL